MAPFIDVLFFFLMCLDPHLVCLEDYPIHTVTGLVKQWLRELPDPLMTFTHYSDFLHAVGEKDFTQDTLCTGLFFSVFFFTCSLVVDCLYSYMHMYMFNQIISVQGKL